MPDEREPPPSPSPWPTPAFLLLVLALLIGLPVFALALGYREQYYPGAFFFAVVLSLPWVGLLMASGGESILGTIFGGIGTRPTAKALLLDFIFIAFIFLMAALGHWLRV